LLSFYHFPSDCVKSFLGRGLTASSQAAIHSVRVHRRMFGAFLPLTIRLRRGSVIPSPVLVVPEI
jgi:hypothetical protein